MVGLDRESHFAQKLNLMIILSEQNKSPPLDTSHNYNVLKKDLLCTVLYAIYLEHCSKYFRI